MIFCNNIAEFILWDTDDQTYAPRTESGAPCGSELLFLNGNRGWEVCGECLHNPALIAALRIGAK
jgi:hypothetical protein